MQPPAPPLSISVALCTYQGARYLREQLDSLLTQQRRPSEIVAFDDASTDGTWQLLETFAQQAREAGVAVSFHRNASNLGYVRNFSQALLAAQGDLVFLCDQDDVWHSDKVQLVAEQFERRPELLMLHSDADLVDQNGCSLQRTLFGAFEVSRDEIAALHRGDAFEVLIKRNVATGATMAIRRSVIARGFQVPDGWIHDEWLAMLASTQGRVDCLEAATIDYRQHGNNQVGARYRGFIERLTGGGISRADFMARMLRRTQSLQDQVLAGNIHLSPPAMHTLLQRHRHAQMRAHLPDRLLARSAAVLAEYASGRYKRFSNGAYSALSDLSRLRG